jgi:hypothetical protein
LDPRGFLSASISRVDRRNDQVALFRVPSKIRADERAGRDQLEPASADVVQRAGDEPRPEPAPLEGGIDLRVDELDHPGSDAVLDHDRALVADSQLVAMLSGVVDDARFRSGAQELSARSRASSRVSAS